MTQPPIRFDDGAAYEQMMGTWSRLAGAVFLDWLAPRPGLRWIDIGCGNGCFTELIVERCAPVKVVGIDPSEGQLAFARERPAAQAAVFQRGDAMALPYPEDSFDAAAMALVVFFLPEPAGGIAEMTRVVRRGGIVASYSWDMLGGGFSLEPIRQEMAAMGIALPLPPSAAASSFDKPAPGSRRWRPTRSGCSGPSPILKIFGRHPSNRSSARRSELWPTPMSRRSKSV